MRSEVFARAVGANLRKAPTLLGCLAFVFFAAFAKEARSDEPAPAEAPPLEGSAKTETVRTWYGWQTLLTDAGAGALFAASHAARDPAAAWTFFTLSIGGYVAGAPLVHIAHGQWMRAGLSAGTRLALPTAIGLLVHAAGTCDGEPSRRSCQKERASIGVVVGLATAVIVDASLFAWKTTPRTPPPSAAYVLPTFEVSAHGAEVGLGGAF